jgi:hypothetical protein
MAPLRLVVILDRSSLIAVSFWSISTPVPAYVIFFKSIASVPGMAKHSGCDKLFEDAVCSLMRENLS